MSSTGFNPITGQIISRDHFKPKWGEDVKAPIREALLTTTMTSTQIADKFKVPPHLVSNVRTSLIRSRALPSRKERIRESIATIIKQHTPPAVPEQNNGNHTSAVADLASATANLASAALKVPSAKKRGGYRVSNETNAKINEWKDKYVSLERRYLDLEEQVEALKLLLKRSW